MRALLVLLLLANLGFLALSRGWLEPQLSLSARQQREPQRLAAQVEARSVRVLDPSAAAAAGTLQSPPPAPATEASAPPAPAPAPVTAAASTASLSTPMLACVQAGPFTAEELQSAEAALQQLPPPQPDWRRVGSAAGPDAPEARAWLRIDRPDAVMRQRLSGLVLPGDGFVPCP